MARTALLALAIVTTLLAGQAARAPAAPAGASAVSGALQLDDIEEQFLVLLNGERSALGLTPLAPYFDLEDDAEAQTSDMIALGDIYHTPDLTVVATGWQALGENVGYGPTVEKLHTAFMNSPHHRDNIVGDYDRVGIGADRSARGVIFVTFIFMRSQAPTPMEFPAESVGPAAGLAAALWLGLR